MNILIIIRVALRALAKNKMRRLDRVGHSDRRMGGDIAGIDQPIGGKQRCETRFMSLGGTNVIYVWHSGNRVEAKKNAAGRV